MIHFCKLCVLDADSVLGPVLGVRGVPVNKCIPVCVLSHFNSAFATLWTVACQAPLSMAFSRPEFRSGLPFPSPGDLPNPGIELTSLMSPELAGGFLTTSTTWETQINIPKSMPSGVIKGSGDNLL